MSLDATTRRRYARQLLLHEIGESGQERLSASGFRREAGSDGVAYAVASDYLRRAGCRERESEGTPTRTPSAEAVADFAGVPSLIAPAAAILGALAAVDHLKVILGVGRPSALPAGLTLQPKRGHLPPSTG